MGARCLYQLMKLSLRTNLRNTFVIHCAASERGVLTEKKEEIESSSAKLMAFRHTCWAAYNERKKVGPTF